jgi:hypothetical protein
VLSVKNAVKVAGVILTAIMAFQIAVAAGAPWGAYTQGGQHHGVLTTHGRVLAGLSVLLLLVMAFSLLARVGQGPFKRVARRRLRLLYWFTTIYAGLSVVLNLITKSTVEREIWAPVSIVLFALVLFTMRRTRFHRFL